MDQEYSPYVLNHGFKLNVSALLILAFGFWQHVQEQIATIEADLHLEAYLPPEKSIHCNGKANCGNSITVTL